MKKWLLCFLLLISQLAFCNVNDSFEKLKTNPDKLNAFIAEMPKGGELHYHLAGGVSPATMLHLAKSGQYHFCKSNTICDDGERAEVYLSQPYNVESTIRAWSMPEKLIDETGHDHFFATFLKFWPLVFDHRGAMLAEILREAERQHIHYLEVMILIDNNQAAALTHGLPWTENYAEYRSALFKKGLKQLLSQAPEYLDKIEQLARQELGCQRLDRPACHIPMRYQMIVLREQDPAAVFSEALFGFEMAKADPRVVAVNLVQAEDDKIALRDYTTQMKIFNYFHNLYPTVKISLHAGELRPQVSSKENLSFHVTEAINIGRANRIGHGVTVVYEKNLGELLHTIKTKDILFEINLSSNHQVLDLKPEDHPFPWLLKHGVALTLSTDDPGVLQTDLNHEYQLAVETYNLDYQTVKWLNRNALHYSFLSGQSIWQHVKMERLVPACQHEHFDKPVSPSCQQFLQHNEKARVQWTFERELKIFENKYN